MAGLLEIQKLFTMAVFLLALDGKILSEQLRGAQKNVVGCPEGLFSPG